MPTITTSYGYDIHSIEVDHKTLERIQAGECVEIDGQGFAHETDGEVIDHWVFNRSPGEIYFWLDNGAEFYGDQLWVDRD